MTVSLRHRGPDGDGIWCLTQKGLAFGHRRLAVIDLTEAGRQPMTSADGRYTITFNGEIYNYRELRDRLRARGVAFRGESDTEVILACCMVYGLRETLALLNGMFAFALWDDLERSIYLARDRFGEKPLYWRNTPDRFAFASELKALRADRRAIDRDECGIRVVRIRLANPKDGAAVIVMDRMCAFPGHADMPPVDSQASGCIDDVLDRQRRAPELAPQR